MIYDNANAVITQPGKDRYFGFNAPMEPGCYKAYLTVTYSYFVLIMLRLNSTPHVQI